MSSALDEFDKMSETELGFEKDFIECFYVDMRSDKTKQICGDLRFITKDLSGFRLNNNFDNLYTRDYGEDTAYLAISSFDIEFITKDKESLINWFKKNSNKKNIIILIYLFIYE